MPEVSVSMLVSNLDDESVSAGVPYHCMLSLSVSLYSLTGEMLNTRWSEKDEPGRAVVKSVGHIF